MAQKVLRWIDELKEKEGAFEESIGHTLQTAEAILAVPSQPAGKRVKYTITEETKQECLAKTEKTVMDTIVALLKLRTLTRNLEAAARVLSKRGHGEDAERDADALENLTIEQLSSPKGKELLRSCLNFDGGEDGDEQGALNRENFVEMEIGDADVWAFAAKNELCKRFFNEHWDTMHPGKANPLTETGSDEEDLVLEPQNDNVICPITRKKFVEPVRNKICGHTYSREAIFKHLQQKGTAVVNCPVAGCRATVRMTTLEKDRAMEEKLSLYRYKEFFAATQTDGNASGDEQDDDYAEV